MNNKRINYFLLVIFIIAFLLRLGPIFQLTLGGDQVCFHNAAIEISEGRGFSSNGVAFSFRPPGYSFFLAAIYFFKGNEFSVKVIQVLMGSFLCIFIYILGKKVFSQAVGLISALILAFNLNFVYMPANILSENLFMIIFFVSMLYFVNMWNYPSFKNRAILGFTLGLAALVRAEIQLLPFFIFLAMIIKASYDRQKIIGALRNFMVILLFFLLAIIPWTIRNYRLHHTFVPIATEGGRGLYMSYPVLNLKGMGSDPKDEVTRKGFTTPMSEIERSRYFYKESFKYIRGHLSRLPKLIILKTLHFWSPFDWELTQNRGLYNLMFVFSLPFFILGTYFLRKRIVEFLPLFIPILYLFIIALVFQGASRFRAQVEPCIIIISAIGIWHFVSKFANKFIPYLVISSFLVVNFIIYLYTEPVKASLRCILHGLGLW